MERQPQSQKDFLFTAAKRYRESMAGSVAEAYLAERGLSGADTASYGLGFVADPLPGHEQFRGRLAIPYLRQHPELGVLVVSIRYRCVISGCDHDGHPKYCYQTGDHPRLYNTAALLRPTPSVAITEGELDAVSAELAGIPAVGVPGATSWKPHFREPFLGYREVYILADGDEAGIGFANGIAKELPNARVIPMPAGSDVNDLVNTHGRQALLDRIKQ